MAKPVESHIAISQIDTMHCDIKKREMTCKRAGTQQGQK